MNGSRAEAANRRQRVLVAVGSPSTELKVDRAIYAVDDRHRIYRFARRNPRWRRLSRRENERNKRHLDGYTRVFTDGRRKVFRFPRPA